MYRLQCFGSATVFDPEGQEVHFRSRKHLGLLLYLCAHANRSLTRPHLASLLWNTEEQLARHSLSQALYDLRNRLAPLKLHTRGGTLRIGERQIAYEAGEFESLVKAGQLERAVELYRGEFAPNLETLATRRFRRWLEGERSRFTTLGQATLRRYMAECDRRGLWSDVCLAALRLVKLNPLDEAGHRALMKALWLQGDQHSALQHYAEVEETLVRELPEGPTSETLDLIGRIRSSRPPVVDPHPEGDTMLPLVGREREFEASRRVFRSLEDGGKGRLVVVRGEAGIGKTRLLQELKKVSAIEGLTYLESRCYPAESDIAYGPILDGIEPVATRIAAAADREAYRYHQLGHLFPDLFEPYSAEEQESVDPAVRRRRLFEEVTDLVRRTTRKGPVVWVVEDVQWVDAASASLLHYIGRRLQEERILIILSLRTGQPLREPARQLTEETTGSDLAVETVDLGPLSREAVRELLAAVGEDHPNPSAVAFAERCAGGNPFYALEILRAANDSRSRGELPPSSGFISDRLRNVLTLRLRGLSAKALRVLEAVGALERYATPAHVAAVAGLSREGAAGITEELRGRHLLRERQGSIEFAHDIVREFVYSNLGLLQRSALHLTVAEVLAGASDVKPATLARHFERGGDRARAYEFAMRAARASMSSSAHSEAASMASLAAAVAASTDARFEALRLQAEAEFAAGRFREAERHFDAILSLYPELPAELRVPLRLSILKAKVESSDWAGATACLRVLEREVETVPDAEKRLEWELEARALVLKVAILTKDDVEARRTHEAIRRRADLAVEAGELTPQARAEALCSQIVYATFFESSSRAARMLSQIRSFGQNLPRNKRQQITLYETLVQIRLAEWDKAEVAAAAGLRLAHEVNDMLHQAHFLNNLSCIALERGVWRDAERYARQSLDAYNALKIDRYSALPPVLNCANANFYQGAIARAVPLYRKALDIAITNGSPSHQAEIHASLGLIALQTGQEEELHRHVKALLENRATLTGGYDRFKVEWFQAYLQLLRGVRGAQVSQDLGTAAAEERERDRVNYLKLRWLQLLLGDIVRVEAEAKFAQTLTTVDMTWFVHFTRRWLHKTQGHAWQNGSHSGGDHAPCLPSLQQSWR